MRRSGSSPRACCPSWSTRAASHPTRRRRSWPRRPRHRDDHRPGQQHAPRGRHTCDRVLSAQGSNAYAIAVTARPATTCAATVPRAPVGRMRRTGCSTATWSADRDTERRDDRDERVRHTVEAQAPRRQHRDDRPVHEVQRVADAAERDDRAAGEQARHASVREQPREGRRRHQGEQRVPTAQDPRRREVDPEEPGHDHDQADRGDRVGPAGRPTGGTRPSASPPPARRRSRPRRRARRSRTRAAGSSATPSCASTTLTAVAASATVSRVRSGRRERIDASTASTSSR